MRMHVLANTPRPGPFDLGEIMRCFAATLMSVSVLVTGATTAFPEEPCWRNPEECVNHVFDPPDIKEEIATTTAVPVPTARLDERRRQLKAPRQPA